MSNKFLAFLTTAEKDVVHVVERAPAIAASLIKLITDGTKLAPEVHKAVEQVADALEQFVIAAGGAAALKLESPALDVTAVAALKSLITVFLANYPVIQKAAGVALLDVENTVKQAAA